MLALAETSAELAQGDRLARRNAVVLAVAQALAGGNNSADERPAALLAPCSRPTRARDAADQHLRARPVGGTLPVGWLARRFGRRAAFESVRCAGYLPG